VFDQEVAQPARQYTGKRHGDERQPTPLRDGHHEQRDHGELGQQMQCAIRRTPVLRKIRDVEFVEGQWVGGHRPPRVSNHPRRLIQGGVAVAASFPESRL